MSTEALKVYFDFNIFDYIVKKGLSVNELKKSNIEYYISVAHAEEFYKMKRNNTNNQNQDSIERIEKIMMYLDPQGVLNPSLTHIFHKRESFDSALKRAELFDTRTIVESAGENCYKMFRQSYKELREENKDAINYSNISPQDIWEVDIVKRKIGEYNNYKRYYNKEGFEKCTSVYGLFIADIIKPVTKDLTFGCYPNIKDSYTDLECIIKYLFNTLEECGYNSDKDVRTSISFIHDIQHAIYATYCDLLISNDGRFGKKAEAVYYFLGMPIKVMNYEDYISKFIK